MEYTEITELTTMQHNCLAGINKLIQQLSLTAEPMTSEQLERLIASNASHLYIAIKGEEIIGMCTLALYDAPTGRKAWIEDVVVDAGARGTGLGRRLVAHAIEEAHRYAPTTLMLTSRSSRIAANRLYQTIGFERKETNVYRMNCK